MIGDMVIEDIQCVRTLPDGRTVVATIKLAEALKYVVTWAGAKFKEDRERVIVFVPELQVLGSGPDLNSAILDVKQSICEMIRMLLHSEGVVDDAETQKVYRKLIRCVTGMDVQDITRAVSEAILDKMAQDGDVAVIYEDDEDDEGLV